MRKPWNYIKLRKGQRFGDWIIIDPESERDRNRYYVLCFNEKSNNLTYVNKHHLTHNKLGHGYGSIGGHSTRNKFKGLPKHVYTFTPKNINHKKHFRVAYQRGKIYKTIGYYHTLDEAAKVAETIPSCGY